MNEKEKPLPTDSGVFKGWEASSVYAATNEVKVGASSKAGVLTSPALAGQGEVTLRFSARTFGTDGTTILAGVSADGGTSWSEEAVTPGALPMGLGPGESAEVVVAYRPTAPGRHEARWVMASDDPEEPQHEVVFRGLTPEGAVRVLDRDELDAALADGLLDAAEYQTVLDTGAALCRDLEKNRDAVLRYCEEHMRALLPALS